MNSTNHNRFDLESLEPRLLLSADGLGVGALHDSAQDELERPLAVVEVAAGYESCVAGAGDEDSIFGDFEVEVSLGEETADEVKVDERAGQDGADLDVTLTAVEMVTVPADESGGAGEERAAVVEATQSYNSEVVPDGAADEAVPMGLEGSGDPTTEIMVETLHAANGPPADQAGTDASGGERILNLNQETAQNIGNQLVIHEGETLKGTWAADIALIQNGGRVSPGNSPGIQSVATYTLLSGELEMEIAGAPGPGMTGAGVTYDQLQVTGLATLGGSGRLRITILGGYVPVLGAAYPIITWGSHAGQFENYLGTASAGNDRSFVMSYTGAGLTVTVTATPNTYDLVKADVEGVINQLGELGEKLDAAGDFAETLPFIGESVGSLVATVSAIQGVLLDKLNDLGAGLSLADVTAYLEGLEGTVLMGYTMHVEGIIGTFGATTAQPFSWKYDIFFTRTDTVNYDLGDNVAFGGVVSGAATGSVTSRFDLDFAFGKDGGGAYVSLEEFKACVDLNTAPSISVAFGAPIGLTVAANGTAVLNACLTIAPNAGILTSGKIYLATLTGLGDGSASVITNFTWTPTASINVDLTLTGTSSINLGAGIVIGGGGNAHLKIVGSDLFNTAPDVDIDFTGASVMLTMPGLPSIKGSFDINTDGALTYIDVGITELKMLVGATQIVNMTGTASLVYGDSQIAGKADLTLGSGPVLPNLTITGGVWHFELNTGNAPATVPYDGGTVELPAGPYLRVEADGAAVGFTINPTFSLSGNFVFEKSGSDVAVGASDVSFNFTDGTNTLMSITEGVGGFIIKSNGIAGMLQGTFAENIPVVDVSGTFGVEFNTTGVEIDTTITVDGGSVAIDTDPGTYLQIWGDDTVVEVLGVGMSGNFFFENRETTTGGERVITVAVTNLNFNFADLTTDLVSLTNGTGAFIITNTGMAGTASITYAVDVFGLAAASGTGTVMINQLATPVTETVNIGGANVNIAMPGGPYLRVDTVGTVLSILNSDLTGNFSYEQKTTGDGDEVVSVAVTNASMSLKQGGTNLMTLTGGAGYFIFSDGGMAGTASGTITESLGFLTMSGTLSLAINNTDAAVNESYTLNGITQTVNVPAGPYLKFTGDNIALTMTVGGGIGSITVTGDFGFEQKSTTTLGVTTLDYIKIGATDVDVDITAVGIRLEARDGEGGFVLKTSGFAGEATLGSLALEDAVSGLAPTFMSIVATDMVFRINTTGGVVNETVSVSSTEDVVLDFTDDYYWNYVGVGGAVAVTLSSFADFSGNLNFELFDVATVDTIRIAASDVSMAFTIAGGDPLVSFFNGEGGFVIKNTGIAGTASLQFQTGYVNVSGTILLELNTTAAAANYTWTPPTGPAISFNLTTPNYLRICVNGTVGVGTISIPVNFTIEQVGTDVVFKTKGGVPQVIFTLDSTGTFIPGAYWTGLGLGVDFDFANPSPEEILTFLQRLGNWFNLLGGSDLFDVVIPFSGGTTLGEAVDWVTAFVDVFYSKLVSTEVAVPLPGVVVPAAGPAASFTITLSSDPTPYLVTTAAYVGGLNGLIAAINTAIMGVVGLAGRIEARPSRDGLLSLALTESEIAAGTLSFALTGGSGSLITAGLPATTNSQTISRYTLEQFPLELSTLLGLGTPITYDPMQKLYIFPVEVEVAGTAFDVDFDFGEEIGPLGTASLSGTMNFVPKVTFKFGLGLDLNPADIPRVFSSQYIPVPSNGRITSSLTFKLHLNNSSVPITVSLAKSATNTNTSVADLAADLNAALTAAANYTPPGGVPTDLLQLVRFDSGGTVLVLSGVNEDYDQDGKRDTSEDTIIVNGYLDDGEDADGDGNFDVNEPDWDSDSVLDNRVGQVNQIRITVDQYSTFATELGFGDIIVNTATVDYPYGSYESIGNAPMKGFFLENVEMSASLDINTPAPYIEGNLVFGFLEVLVSHGEVYTDNPANPDDAMMATVGIRDPTTGNQRFYMPALMDVLGDLGTYVDFSLTGGIYAGLKNISAEVGGVNILNSGEISVWIPDINILTLNENVYDVNNAAANTGTFLTYPDAGLKGGFSFEQITFNDILHGLNAVVDKLSEFSAFSFLDEKIPFIDLSLNDLVDYAVQFGDLVDALANGDASNIQEMLEVLEDSIESLFHLDPDDFSITYDTNSINYGSGVSSDVLTHNGGPGVGAWVTFDPGGLNNAFTVTRDVNGVAWNNSLLRIEGSSTVSGNLATASWDPVSKIITILIDPGNTTAGAIVSAINSQIGGAWTAVNFAGNDGTGTVRTNALKFHWEWSTGVAQEIPLHLDIAELLEGLGGDNPGVQAFLSAASSILHVSGSGLLNVSAGAEVNLDFGLDLTDPTTVEAFLYDTTGVTLEAKVTITDLEFDAAIGALGVFVRGGEVTFDYDGEGSSTESAQITLGLKDRDGDGRHYFDSSFLSLDNIGVTAHAGIYAELPLFAPVDSLPVGLSTLDGNGDGFADNSLGVSIPDLVRLLLGDTTALYTTNAAERADMIFAGANNDIRLDVANGSGLSDIKITFSDTGSLSADYLAGSNEIVFGIDSGVTTAAQLLAFIAVPGITNNPGGLTWSLAASDAGNTGLGTLAKITIAAPDLSELFADLDLCTIIDSSVGPLLDGLDETLGDIQQALEETVLNTNLPLIGGGLAGAASFIEDFRNGLLGELRARINAANGSAIGALEDAIKEGIWNSLGPDGLNLLVNFDDGTDFAADATFDDLDVTLSCDDGLVVNLRLKKFLAFLDTSANPIDFEIGVPGFGLEVDGNVVLGIGFDLRLVFGFNKTDGFYLGTEGGMEDPELVLEFSATIPGLHAGGSIFFLQLDVMDDPDAPSHFTGGFYVDLMDPNGDGKLTFAELSSANFEDIIHGELSAEADLNLDIAASFGGNANFPRLLADFHLGWEWSLSEGSSDPVIEFNNLRLDLGTFISDVLGPILEEVQKITQPLQPIIDIATFRLPIFSELAGKDITLLDIAQGFGYLDPETRKFIEDVIAVVELINSIPTGSGSIYIPLGAFSMLTNEDGEYDTNPLGNLSDIDLDSELANLGSESTATGTQISQTTGFVDGANAMDGFSLPWLKNPSEIFGLFTGKPVRLVEWQLPTFAFEFTYTQKLPIYPPLYAQFGGTVGAYINIGVGFDTYGIQKFIENGAKDVAQIFEGFYIADYDAEGNERAELTLRGEIFAGVSLSIGPVEVGVQGGLGVEVTFDLNDIEKDGRVRIGELIALAEQDPRCIFDIHGRVYLFLEAFLKVDLLLFKIDKTWRFGEFTLFEFESVCPVPVLASVTGGVLTIHVGLNAGLRLEIDTNDNSETFVIQHVSGAQGTETVSVQWGNYTQTFGPGSADHPEAFDSIVAHLGEGNDYLDLGTAVTTATITGGAGNDTILLGVGITSTAKGEDGDDIITAGSDDVLIATGVIIEGGNGADLLTGVKTAITIKGDGGSDKIYGTPGNDTLEGGDGADLIYAYGGDDIIKGEAGNDTIYADSGADTVEGGDGNDLVEGGLGNNRIHGGSGSDRLYGGSDHDLIVGGTGDDEMYGYGGVDLLVGDDFNWTAFTAANMNSLVLAGSAGGSFALQDITGSGNDKIIGGGSYDVIFGGDGDDYLFGGNLFTSGVSQPIEEDDNDFIDGGRGDDEIFGDDSLGKTGDRITGISIEGVVFHDLNLTNLYDGDPDLDDSDRGLAGVIVKLYKGSDDSLFSETVTDSAGRWQLLGLDPLSYYLKFISPIGYTVVTINAGSALGLDDINEPGDDSDVYQESITPAGAVTARTAAFDLGYDEAETTITAGYAGDPTLTIYNEAVYERSEGQTNSATFTLTLSGPSGVAITLDYHTLDGDAGMVTPAYEKALNADNDYEPIIAGMVTFQPGEISKTITVIINGDSKFELHEGFFLIIEPQVPSQLYTSPTSISTKQTIINDDAAPSITITDVTISEPATALDLAEMRFTVRLSNQHWAGLVKVDYLTTDASVLDGDAVGHSATAGAAKDYIAQGPTTLTFGAGEVEKIITILVNLDNIDEYDEAFYVNLFNPVFSTIGDDRGYGIILDTDAAPTVLIKPFIMDADPSGQSTTVFELHTESTMALFDVIITGATEKTITVNWSTARGTAEPGFGIAVGDYFDPATSDTADEAATSDTTLVFAPNGMLTQTKQISVEVQGDTLDEDVEEHFYVNLLTADGATITQNHGVVRILDDDGPGGSGGPYDVRFARANFQDWETETTHDGFLTLVRTPGPGQAYTILTVTGGTATSGADYIATTSQLIVFAVGEYVKQVPISIIGDEINEYNETITFSLRRPTGAPSNGVPYVATMTILDDDNVSIYVHASITNQVEGTGGHVFHVHLVDADNPVIGDYKTTEQNITFNYRTLAITATAGSDYVSIPLTAGLFNSPANSFLSIPVTDVGNATPEFSEVFRVLVSSVVGASVYVPYADGVILDDDKALIEGYIFQDDNENGYWDDVTESAFGDVNVTITDSGGGVYPVTTTPAGYYSASILLGDLTFRVLENDTIEGWEVTTENDSQSAEFDGSVGLTPLTPVGYRTTEEIELPNSADSVGRGGTDDTLFGGPGDDYIDGGAGDDHIVGGHWQTATDSAAPINTGTYDATIIANYIKNGPPVVPPLVPTEIQDPQTAPIWTVNTAIGAGTGLVSGNIFVDTNDSSRHDEGLYLFEVVVTLLDCDSNIIDVQATSTGFYEFDGLYENDYYLVFSLPAGQQFVAPNVGADGDDSDAEYAGATAAYHFNVGQARTNVDVGLEVAGSAAVASTSSVEFDQPEYHVVESAGVVTITLIRTNASTAEAVVWFAEDGAALEGSNYTGVQGIVIFGIGETLATFEIPILDSGLPSACDVKDFHLSVRRPTGQPIRGGEADVYIHGEGGIPLTDDDTILGGEDWDIILGDSGHITSYVVQAQFVNPVTDIEDNAGMGHDTIYGDNGPDYINSQLGNDLVVGGEGNDYVFAGYGDDRIIVELDDDTIDGEHGTDTIAGVSNRTFITLTGGADPQELRFGTSAVFNVADSVFTLYKIEKAEVFGTPGDDTITINTFAGEVFVFGDDGNDVLQVQSDAATMTAADASAIQKLIYLIFYGFNVEANVTLSTGAAYHFGEMETVKLTGGPSANVLDGGGCSFDLIFDGAAGNDTLIGGGGDDTFLFDLDLVNGADTVTGNGGLDTISFAGSSNTAHAVLDLGNIGSNQTVRTGSLLLNLTAEDIEGATGGDGNDNLTGNSLDNILDGGLGGDVLTGRAGSETYRYDLDLGLVQADEIVENGADAGHDIIDFSTTTGVAVSLNMQLTAFQPVGGGLSLKITGTGVDEVIGGSLADNITGNSGNNTLRGGPGDDTLYGAQGDDFLDGGAGTDLLDGGEDGEINGDSIAAIANSNFTLTDTMLLRNGSDVDNLFNIETATLTGGASNNVFTLTGWTGNATINGKGGTDTIVFTADEDMDLATSGGTDVLSVGIAPFTFTASNVERWTLTGGVSANNIDASLYTRAGGFLTLSGNGGADTIIGSQNDDLINGGSGNDNLTGGSGNDTILGGTGTDRVIETTDLTMWVVNSGLEITRVATGVETDDHTSIEILDLSGGAGPQTFVYTGSLASVTGISFAGGPGSDVVGAIWNGNMTATNALMTLDGAPPISISNMEIVALLDGAGDHLLDASLFTGVGGAFLSGGGGNDVLKGTGVADTLIGNAGNDSLEGFGGNDSLNGGDGDDTYLFNTFLALGTDTIIDSGGTDKLDFSASTVTNVVNLTLIANPVHVNLTLNWALGTLIENLTGGSAVDTFTGDANANVLTGNGGNDNLSGGLGNDTYVFDVDTNQGADILTDTGGVDTLDFSATSSAKNLTVNLNLGGVQQTDAATLFLSITNASSMENVVGGEGNDILTGNAANNNLTGNGGNDTLTGNNGNDTLTGGAGNDTLQGNANDDTYVFNAGLAGQGLDTVSDSGGTDTLDFSATSGLGITFTLGSTAIQTVALAAPTNLRVQLNSAAAFENVIGGSGNDTLTGNNLVNTFTGNAGSDTINGSVTGNDRLAETRDVDFTLLDFSATQALLTVNGIETDTLNNIHYATLTGGDSANTIDVSEFGSLATVVTTAFLNGMGGDDTLIGGGDADLLLDHVMNFDGGTGDDTYVFDLALRSLNTITEGAGDLHDTIIGAGGGLVDLAAIVFHTPDAINYPFFQLKFTIASTVEHTL